jgi:hypothetical protein
MPFYNIWNRASLDYILAVSTTTTGISTFTTLSKRESLQGFAAEWEEHNEEPDGYNAMML